MTVRLTLAMISRIFRRSSTSWGRASRGRCWDSGSSGSLDARRPHPLPLLLVSTVHPRTVFAVS